MDDYYLMTVWFDRISYEHPPYVNLNLTMIRGHERLNRNTHRNTTFSYLYLETGLKLKKKKEKKINNSD